MRRLIPILVCVFLLGSYGDAQTPAGAALPKSPLVERVGDTGFIQLQSRSFALLTDRQKGLAYWLTQAAIAIDPIIYDQLSRFGLRQKRMLEGIVAFQGKRPGATSDAVSPAVFSSIREYALLFWANRGNHNEITGQKFLPAFTSEQLLEA